MRYNPSVDKRKSNPRRKIVQISSFEKSSEASQCSQCSTITWNIKDLFDLLEEHLHSPNFAALLSVRQVMALGQVCKSFRKIFNSQYVRLVIRLGNLDPDLRYLFWIGQAPYIK